jgi:DnaA regulatory inactivator Hda
MSGGQLPLEFGQRVSFAPEDLFVGSSNAEAVAWLEAWPAGWRARGLVLVGPTGSGKTHLASIWSARAAARLVAADAIDPALVDQGIRAVVVEDVERTPLANGLLHLYNRLVEIGGSLLLTATAPPRAWNVSLPDLRSRLQALPVAELRAPDDALLDAVLVKLFADRQLRPSPEVVSFIAQRVERSLAAIARAVATLDRAALAERRALTLPFVRQALRAAGVID